MPQGPDSATGGPAPATVGILTVSDRASRGDYADRGGPAVESYMRSHFIIGSIESRLVPDEADQIASAIRELASHCCIVLTTGGTGPAARDVTPEATAAVCGKLLPGFGERMRAASWDKVPTAILSRQTAGICGSALVVNLPGSPRAIAECLDPILQAIPHAVRLQEGRQSLRLLPEFQTKKKGDCKEADAKEVTADNCCG